MMVVFARPAGTLGLFFIVSHFRRCYCSRKKTSFEIKGNSRPAVGLHAFFLLFSLEVCLFSPFF